jgi:hypothetical protein
MLILLFQGQILTILILRIRSNIITTEFKHTSKDKNQLTIMIQPDNLLLIEFWDKSKVFLHKRYYYSP